MQVKKYIEIPEEILVGLAEGRYVEGSLHRDQWTGKLIFKAYNRQYRGRKPAKTICQLESGWLKDQVLQFGEEGTGRGGDPQCHGARPEQGHERTVHGETARDPVDRITI